jgi:hypothetical protein
MNRMKEKNPKIGKVFGSRPSSDILQDQGDDEKFNQ